MKFAVKGLSVLALGALAMGAVAVTPASAGGKSKCPVEKEITKIFSGEWLKR